MQNMTLTDHVDTIRDALLQSAGTIRILIHLELVPAPFEDEAKHRIEMCEAGIASLRRVNLALQLQEPVDLQCIEDLIAEQATVTLQAVKAPLALPQKTQ